MAGRNLTQDELRADAAYQSSLRAEQVERERRQEVAESVRREMASARRSLPNDRHAWMAM